MCIRMYTCIRTYIRMYIRMYMCMYIYVYTYVYVCIYACIYVCICTCIYTCIRARTSFDVLQSILNDVLQSIYIERRPPSSSSSWPQVCCSVLQCVLQCVYKLKGGCPFILHFVAAGVLQCVAVCCSVLQGVAVRVAMWCSVL